MPEQTGKVDPPRGFSRLLWRAPIWIYRLGLGGFIKERMLLLHHVGRSSGQPRQNVDEDYFIMGRDFVPFVVLEPRKP